MPLKLNVGLSKKVGLPDYGSRGAACSVEMECDGSLLDDLEKFHGHVRQAYVACAQAVEDELQRQQHGANSNGAIARKELAKVANGRQQNSGPRRATQSQVRAIQVIADREGVDLTELLQGRHGVDHPQELSITDASKLIDELKCVSSGARR